MCQGGIIAEGGQATASATVRVIHIPATIAASTTALMKPAAEGGDEVGRGMPQVPSTRTSHLTSLSPRVLFLRDFTIYFAGSFQRGIINSP